MRSHLFAIVMLVGCTGDHGSRPDAGSYCMLPPEPADSCRKTCGNSVVDACRFYYMASSCFGMWLPMNEECDGTAMSSTCEQHGYFGGSMSCSTMCKQSSSSCDPCAPGNLACVDAGLESTSYVAASGTRVAIGDRKGLVLFEGAAIVKTVPVPDLWAIVPTPNGWLLAATQPQRLVPMASDGTLGTPQPLDNDPIYENGIAVAGSRVLVASSGSPTSPTLVHATIYDASGNVVVPRFTVFEGGPTTPSIATDGTSFFIAAPATLARIAADGTRTLVAFPAGTPRIVWSGTTGWYIAKTASDHVVQRFDAAGALVGTATTIALGDTVDFIAAGDALYAIRFQPAQVPRLEVLRIDATGTLGTPTVVGVGDSTSAARMSQIGTDLVIAWHGAGGSEIARIAPPL